jgi:translation initiation factor 3 subunit C
MIWSEELAASLDQSTGTVAFHRAELSRVQQLAQSLADRISQMAEQNAKTLDNKLGGAANWTERSGDGKKTEGGDQQQERRGHDRSRRGGGSARGRGSRFSQGLGGRVAGATT